MRTSATNSAAATEAPPDVEESAEKTAFVCMDQMLQFGIDNNYSSFVKGFTERVLSPAERYRALEPLTLSKLVLYQVFLKYHEISDALLQARKKDQDNKEQKEAVEANEEDSKAHELSHSQRQMEERPQQMRMGMGTKKKKLSTNDHDFNVYYGPFVRDALQTLSKMMEGNDNNSNNMSEVLNLKVFRTWYPLKRSMQYYILIQDLMRLFNSDDLSLSSTRHTQQIGIGFDMDMDIDNDGDAAMSSATKNIKHEQELMAKLDEYFPESNTCSSSSSMERSEDDEMDSENDVIMTNGGTNAKRKNKRKKSRGKCDKYRRKLLEYVDMYRYALRAKREGRLNEWEHTKRQVQEAMNWARFCEFTTSKLNDMIRDCGSSAVRVCASKR